MEPLVAHGIPVAISLALWPFKLALYGDLLAGEVLADHDHLNITEGLTFDSVRDLVASVVERDQRHARTYETR